MENVIQAWKKLHNKEVSLMRRYKAELRRCKTLQEIALHPYFQELRYQNKNIPVLKLALILGVLVQVETNIASDKTKKQKIGILLAENDVKEVRFRRLMVQSFDLKSQEVLVEGNQLLQQLRGIIKLINKSVPLSDLVNSLEWWNNQTKQDWAYGYYTNLKK